MKKSEFMDIVNDGIRRNKLFMAVKIFTEGNPGPEVIVNPQENFSKKVAYFDKAYNNDMELIAAKNSGKRIAVVDVQMTSNLNDLVWFAI